MIKLGYADSNINIASMQALGISVYVYAMISMVLELMFTRLIL